MKWVRDTTGRFQKRPHYLPDDLDTECERIVTDFLIQKYGKVEFPIRTDDLTCLLERDVRDLDLYADLSEEEGLVEGVTEFRRGKKPVVKISATLTQTPNLENRLRTTLTHEYGHVHFHDCLYQIEDRPASLFEGLLPPPASTQHANRCKRDSMISLDGRDWMEWQAGFVCGAMLIPTSALLELVKACRRRLDITHAAIPETGIVGSALIQEVAQVFQTSKDAARVRLLQKNILSASKTESLF